MFFKPREHEPSHIHALYGEYVGIFDIRTHEMLDGDLPKKAQMLVQEWLKQNDEELQKMWDNQHIRKLPPLEGDEYMIPRIKNMKTTEKYKLDVVFDHGDHVIYDVEEDIRTIPEFSVLAEQPGLFENAQIDESRTCVYWNDMVDLPSDTILEYGKKQ